MNISKSHVRRYWFGEDDETTVANTVLLMERDRLDQYKAALDITEHHFKGVFSGLTGCFQGHRLSVVYSIGPAHVADCVSFLAHGYNVKRFIATGSVGGLDTEMGDVVVTHRCTTQDGYSLAVMPDAVRRDDRLGRVVDIDMPETADVPKSVQAAIASTFQCEIRKGRMCTVPAVCLEDKDKLEAIKDSGYVAVDLETGPFLAACANNNASAFCIHWVTDLPLTRSFYYAYHGDPQQIESDKEKKRRQWLNMPRLILPILGALTR